MTPPRPAAPAELAARTFPRLSVDLIYALPSQTLAAWREQLAAAIDLGAEHVSPYQLTIEAGTAFDRAVGRGLFRPADDETGAALYETTRTVLEAAGFEAYEVSNHARGEAARSRHNLVYWRGQDYVGAGPGAHGRLTLDGVRTATTAATAKTRPTAVNAALPPQPILRSPAIFPRRPDATVRSDAARGNWQNAKTYPQGGRSGGLNSRIFRGRGACIQWLRGKYAFSTHGVRGGLKLGS